MTAQGKNSPQIEGNPTNCIRTQISLGGTLFQTVSNPVDLCGERLAEARLHVSSRRPCLKQEAASSFIIFYVKIEGHQRSVATLPLHPLRVRGSLRSHAGASSYGHTRRRGHGPVLPARASTSHRPQGPECQQRPSELRHES